MSANFLDKSGLCAGADRHMYFSQGPLNVPLPNPKKAHGVVYAHFLGSKRWRIAHTVTTNGWAVLQSNWAMIVIPHVPSFSPAMHTIAEPVNLAAIVLTSSSTPVMSAHSVTGEKQALCTSAWSCLGINIDCGDPPFPGAMVDVNTNSVETSPTLGDYLGALFSAFCAVGYAWAGAAIIGDKFKALGKLEEIIVQALASLGLAVVQTLLDVLSVTVHAVADPVNFVINTIAQMIQDGVDAPAPAASPALGH
jgi:hypothetical protein